MLSAGAVGLAAAFLVGSLFVANLIAWALEHFRNRRIEEHAARIAAATGGSTPITIITGFLGAGKTTLLNRILAAPDLPYKIAVIENEVGAISIDHSLLAENADAARLAKDGIFVLRNGCMCCTSTGSGSDLERVLSRLVDLAASSAFDYVVVETSGLADPGPILRIFLHHRMAQSRFHIDGVVAMIDAASMQRHLEGGLLASAPEAQRQLAYADVVLVNKTDRAREQGIDVDALERRVAGVNPTARRLRTVRAAVPLADILGIHAFDPAVAASLSAALPEPATPRHATGVSAVAVRATEPMDPERLRAALAQLVDELGASLYRIKGIIDARGSQRPLVLQGVCAHLEAAPADVEWPERRRQSSIVVIGRNLDHQRILERIRGACARPAAVAIAQAGDAHAHGPGHGHGHGHAQGDGASGHAHVRVQASVPVGGQGGSDEEARLRRRHDNFVSPTPPSRRRGSPASRD